MWLAFTILSPFLNALVNYIDKYLIEKVVEGRGVGSLAIFSALMGLPVALLILIFNPNVFDISVKNALLILLNGTFYVAWVLPYLYALKRDDASVVIPMFQISSIFTFILSFLLLGETFNIKQSLGSLLILVGALGITIEKDRSKIRRRVYKIKSAVLFLVMLSCFFIALSSVIFKCVALEESFLTTSFWENLGIFISALFLFVIPMYRKQFVAVLKKDVVRVVCLNSLNESLTSLARVSLNYATLLVPVALVSFVDWGFQPLFVLAFGILLSKFFPKYVKEDTNSSTILQKLVAILIMLVGTYFVSF